MSDVQLFLEEMYKNIHKEEIKKIEKNISDSVLRKISIMLDNQIISEDDVKEFLRKHNLHSNELKSKKINDKVKNKVISDPCSVTLGSVRSNC